MDKRTERANKILDILKIKNGETIKNLSKKLKVSEMTIRRDLNYLSEGDIIKLLHGAAILNPNAIIEDEARYQLRAAEEKMTNEKSRIGKKAAELLEPDDVIIIDTGTTTEHLARYIPENLPLTVLCYNMNILLKLHHKKSCKLIIAGGYFHENTQMFQSPEGVELIKRNRATKSFISAAGVSPKLGITCANHYEIETKKAAIISSLKKILLVDSSKFESVKQAYFADLKDFDIIISDTNLSTEYADIIKNLGIELFLA